MDTRNPQRRDPPASQKRTPLRPKRPISSKPVVRPGFKGAQDYNNKFMEFAHANTNAAFDFAQKLLGVKSPSEFMELSTEHMQTQTQMLTKQTKELAELAQKVALAGAKPLQVGAANAFNRVG
jgi:phasin